MSKTCRYVHAYQHVTRLMRMSFDLKVKLDTLKYSKSVITEVIKIQSLGSMNVYIFVIYVANL